jgi:hypothetical protein
MPQELSPEEVALQESTAALAKEEADRLAKTDEKFGDQSKQSAQVAEAKIEETKTEPVEVNIGETESVAKVVEKQRGNPVDAIVALRKQLQEEREQRILVQGQNQVLSQVLQSGGQPQQQQQRVDPAVLLNQIEDAKLEAADKVDKGELTVREYEQTRSQLERNARQIEQQLYLEQQSRQQPVQVAKQDDLYLAQQTEELANAYPFLEELSADDLEPFHQLALRQAVKEGNPIQSGPLETLRLRTLMVQLAAKVYQPEETKAAASVTQPSSADAQKALDAKLAMQATMPPDTSKLGSGSSAAGMTEAELERRLTAPNLTDAQAEALLSSISPALREKLSIR